jgi:hypothetical protein
MKKRLPKPLIIVLLVLLACLLAGGAAVVYFQLEIDTSPLKSAPIYVSREMVEAIIEEYNQTHGGEGALELSFFSEMIEEGIPPNIYEFDITGEVRGATRGLVFPDNCSVAWDATLTGTAPDGEALVKSPYHFNLWRGEIESGGLAVETGEFSMQEGTRLTAPQAVYAHQISASEIRSCVNLSGGELRGDVRIVPVPYDEDGWMAGGNFWMLGGTFYGAVNSERMTLEDGAVAYAFNLDVEEIDLRGGALHLYDEGTIRCTIFRIESSAEADCLNRLRDCILVECHQKEDSNTWPDYDMEDWTAIGDAYLDSFYSNGEVTRLIIPEGNSLTLREASVLGGGTVVIDGMLAVQEKLYADMEDAVFIGKNAAAFLAQAPLHEMVKTSDGWKSKQ